MSPAEPTAPPAGAPAPSERGRQWPLLIILASVQFTHVLDFVILMPLGPQLMRVLNIGPAQFALQVSAYNFAAAVASLLGAFFLDRFGRKRALIFVYSGFAIGTLACGLAFDFTTLLIARVFTGAFGGIIQALVFAIIGDAFAEKRRGAATGTVMSAFSVASVVGVPIGLSLAAHFDWRMPFLVLFGLSSLILIALIRILPPLKSHMRAQVQIRKSGAVHATLSMLRERNTLIAIGLIVSLMFSGFSVIPFISAYLVANVGLSESDLAAVFLVGGVATFLSARFVGKLADLFGKLRVFTGLAAFSVIPILLLTNLPPVSIGVAILVSALFTVSVSARSIPAMAMITSSIEKARRGNFLSLTSSVQQASAGLASLLAGVILGQSTSGQITNYHIVGYISSISILITIIAAHNLYHRHV